MLRRCGAQRQAPVNSEDGDEGSSAVDGPDDDRGQQRGGAALAQGVEDLGRCASFTCAKDQVKRYSAEVAFHEPCHPFLHIAGKTGVHPAMSACMHASM